MAQETNKKMPLENIKLLSKHISTFNKKKILILGATYKSEVDDLRNSPSEIFINTLKKKKAKLFVHDPYVKKWKNIKVIAKLPAPENFDIIVIAVNHIFYKKLNILKWLGNNKKIILDSNNIINDKIRNLLIKKGNIVIAAGRGDNN